MSSDGSDQPFLGNSNNTGNNTSYKYPYVLEQGIFNLIAGYNFANKSKNVFFTKKNVKDPSVRDREIRDVLNNILKTENLGSYTASSGMIDSVRAATNTTKQAAQGDYGKPSQTVRTIQPTQPRKNKIFGFGGKTSRRKRGGRGRKSRKN